ncbi:XRE family transcriptional regulator [Mitsuaria sp. GD03876]|uniref:helix-turn-helix domain-containing protein n=1 Tax=Mitsuaria sp. GD03876 TaxID=2975399 RepID=UPI00244CC1FE|nr:XRE family transcriptional regulator [Mitsuaria sp. GD03876]MDH0864009.1 XRE family transcriptional regulator [Mitsuaria sp. GD03876]
MTVTQQQLGERIRIARERFHLTPRELGEFVDLSTQDIEAIERGERSMPSSTLSRIAHATGRQALEFHAVDFVDSGALSALFRANPQVADRRQLSIALQRGIAFALQFSSLEAMLGIDRDRVLPPAIDLPDPTSCDDATEQGERIAAQERQRLTLDELCFDRMQHLLETQGVGSVAVPLPEGVSGLMLHESRIGAFVLFNEALNTARQRFALAHEYAHVLMDRHRLGSLSRIDQREDLIELRADAFAAEFLMPREDVVGILFRHRERKVAEAAAGDAGGRWPRVQMLDIAAVAQSFRISRRSALRRVRHLKLVRDDDHASLVEQERNGEGAKYSTLLGLFNPPEPDSRSASLGRLLGLGCEALRRDEISIRKLFEIGRKFGIPRETVAAVVHALALE